jgi:phage-related protein
MARRRAQFTQESIDQQLQQIHLLDPSSSSENLEQLGPIIKQIHANRQQEAFLRTVQGLIESKDADIEKICGDNYQDFISSVSTLFTVKSYTDKMKENISSLDASVAQLGRGLVEKKRGLLQSKKTAANLDEAIDTLQACLRVLDVVNRVGEMVREGKYWSALRVRRFFYLVRRNLLNASYLRLSSPLRIFRACRPLRCRKHRSSNICCPPCLHCAPKSKMP